MIISVTIDGKECSGSTSEVEDAIQSQIDALREALAKATRPFESHRKERDALREALRAVQQERDMLLGKEDAVHVGAQAAVTALHQCQVIINERDSLRSQLRSAHNKMESQRACECGFENGCELLAGLQQERALTGELAAALRNIEFVLREHCESAVLIRDGDISLSRIKPHCAIRKGSAAHHFALEALANYRAQRQEVGNA